MTRVLFVEDDELCRALGLRVLGLFEDIEVTDASSGFEALSLYEQKTFDLIIVDLDLPDISGREIIQTIKKRYKSCPPTVAITAHLKSSDEAPKHIDRLYTKPLTYSMFKDILTMVA